jgi:hypothetical protein
MIRTRIRRLLAAEPFEPFRIKLVNCDVHDIFDPQTVSLERDVIFIASTDQNWVMFPFSKINSIESLIADYHGESAAHDA